MVVDVDAAIGLIWILFWVFWIAAAVNTNASIGVPRGRASWILRLLLIATVLLALRLTRNGLLKPHENRGLVLAGFVLFVMGLAIAVWARFVIGRSWGMPMTQREHTMLVTAGPYGLIRHPIYSGIMLAMLGTALALSNFWAIPFVVLSGYFGYSAFIEERNMERRFPDAYPTYKQHTKMLVPFVF